MALVSVSKQTLRVLLMMLADESTAQDGFGLKRAREILSNLLNTEPLPEPVDAASKINDYDRAMFRQRALELAVELLKDASWADRAEFVKGVVATATEFDNFLFPPKRDS